MFNTLCINLIHPLAFHFLLFLVFSFLVPTQSSAHFVSGITNNNILQCEGGQLMTSSNETVVFTCPQDGNADIIQFTTTSTASSNYAYIITDENDIILTVEMSSHDFESADIGVCFVYGVSYEGSLIATPDSSITTVSSTMGCVELSTNLIEVVRDIPEGGSVFTIGGENSIDICVGNSNDDLVFFDYFTFSASNYTLLLTDLNDELIAELPDFSYNFEQLSAGSCIVRGVSYTGQLTIQPGQNIFGNPISDDCYDLSVDSVLVNKVQSDTDAGMVTDEFGDTTVYTCPFDGNADSIQFINTGTSSANYSYIIADESEYILEVVDSTYDFENSPEGSCLVFGVSYEGNLLFNVDEHISTISSTAGCAQLTTNFVEVIKTFPDGGEVMTTDSLNEITFCVGDGVADTLSTTFFTTSAAPYALVVVDSSDQIIQIPQTDFFDFDNESPGTCFIVGISYTGNFIAQVGDTIDIAPPSDGCYEFSTNSVQVNKVSSELDGGLVSTVDGSTQINICVNDGESDLIELVNTTTSVADYAYILTNESDTIIALLDGNEIELDTFPYGVCIIYGVAYTGNFTAETGNHIDSIALSDECYGISTNAVFVFKTDGDGGMVMTEAGETEVEVCVGDDADDIITFMDTTQSVANYSYIITDDQDNILEILTGNSFNFESADTGTCFAYGLSYSGNIIAMAGDNILNAPLADDCFELSENRVTVHRLDAGPLCITSTEDIGQEALELKVYPNPAGDWVYIYFEAGYNIQRAEASTIKIINFLGQIIMAQEVMINNGRKEYQINLEGLSDGPYLILVEVEEKKTQKVFIKI